MFQKIKNLFRFIRAKRFTYKPLVRVILSKEAFAHNFKVFQNLEPAKQIAPVLKSNAYGHGLIGTAKQSDILHSPFLVVDSYYEALILKNEGITSDILVLGYTFVENILQFSYEDVVFCITTIPQLEKLSRKLKKPRRFHIKIDTGMHRQGIMPEDVSYVVTLIQKNKNIILEGICSHLADADTPNSAYTREQITMWNAISIALQTQFPSIRYTHIEATAGTRRGSEIQANTIRLGLGLYGIDSVEPNTLSLRPVLSMKSVVVGIKSLTKGDRVGYNGTYTAPQAMRIGIIPAGYYEGVDRRLSNKGYMRIKNIDCPIVGRVSMNMTTLDISSVPNVTEGDEVEIISNVPNHKNSAVSIASACGTIPYETLVGIPEKIRREWE